MIGGAWKTTSLLSNYHIHFQLLNKQDHSRTQQRLQIKKKKKKAAAAAASCKKKKICDSLGGI